MNIHEYLFKVNSPIIPKPLLQHCEKFNKTKKRFSEIPIVYK